ncbi:MAG: Dabb family protein [Christensenellales bacterium]|jgi:hypothetical protein
MIRHVVLYTIKDSHKEKIPQLVEAFYGMKGKIPGLMELEAGADELGSERSYDLALITVFESWDAYRAYLDHPAHLPVKAGMHAARSGSVSCDYEIKGE